MRITGARVARSASVAERMDLVIRHGWISPFDTPRSAEPDVDLSGYMLLPGLINAHDHLEFNLFPRLGRGPYGNATEWAHDIYHPDGSPVREHLAVDKTVRFHWGGLKNLMSGATTVAHHNPFEASIFKRGFPVRVVRRLGWAHSLRFSPDLVQRFRMGPAHWPFIVHAAEGVDTEAFSEIARLNQLGAISARTVLVHAVALGRADLELLTTHGVSIIWCPSSNLFMCGRTLSSGVFESGIPIALGSDSALTGTGDLTDEMRAALQTGLVDSQRIYRMVTSDAAKILRLHDGRGAIREGGTADLIALPDRGKTPAETLMDARPDLCLIAGRVKLISRALASRWPRLLRTHLQRLLVEGRGEWFVHADVAFLYRSAATALGFNICLAGKRVAQ
jgi:cytosine/adenosine deaminase-related metal-dependent hydrolase